MINELMLHLHLDISEPQTLIGVLNFESPLKYGTSPGKFFGSFLPLCVPDPCAQVITLPPNFILELAAFLLLADGEFLLVHNHLRGRPHWGGAVDTHVLQQLVGSDLHLVSTLVLDGWGFHLDLGSHSDYKRENYIL
jgi:hypothetical protein